MREALDRQEASRIRGLSTRDAVTLNCTELLLQQLVERLRERPLPIEASFQLWSFIYEQQQDRVPDKLRRSAADIVADHVASSGQGTDDSAANIFIAWGDHRSDYKSVCLSLLRHPRSEIRAVAVSYASWFLCPQDYPLLFEFRNDPDISETSMGGPLRYVLRDHAQRVLRYLTKCPTPYDGDCFEETPEGRVSYQSWAAFLNWYETSNK